MTETRYTKYAKNLVSYFGASLIPMVLSLVANPWIAKNMSPEDYAISGYYTSFSSLISPVIVFYMIHYYIKEYFRRDNQERVQLIATIAKALIWFSGIVSMICFCLMLFYLKFIKEDITFPVSPYLALMVFSLPLTGLLNLKLAEYRMSKNASGYFKLSVSNGVLNVLLAVIFVVILQWGAVGKLLGPFVCNATVFLIMLWQYRSVLAVKTALADFKSIFLFCLPLAASAMLGYFTHGFSTTYLESVGKTAEYGEYVVGSSIGAYLMVFSTAIGNTFQPDLYESTIKKQWSRYSKFCLLQVGLISIVAIAFILLAPFIIEILTAGRYIASTPFAQIIAISTVTSNIYFLINNFCIATNRQNLYLITTVIGSIIIVIMMPIFVTKWEFYGGAWMSVLSYMIMVVVNLILLFIIPIKLKQPKL